MKRKPVAAVKTIARDFHSRTALLPEFKVGLSNSSFFLHFPFPIIFSYLSISGFRYVFTIALGVDFLPLSRPYITQMQVVAVCGAKRNCNDRERKVGLEKLSFRRYISPANF